VDSDPGRILAVDPGKKRIGIAVSDPTRTIASPLEIVEHQSRREDAQEILRLAKEQEATLILIGQPLHWDGEQSIQARGSIKLAEMIRTIGDIPVILVDEYGSTKKARDAGRRMNLKQERRSGHMDDMAAAIILQNYLELQEGLS
jgi:putative Holliday junction resolvase